MLGPGVTANDSGLHHGPHDRLFLVSAKRATARTSVGTMLSIFTGVQLLIMSRCLWTWVRADDFCRAASLRDSLAGNTASTTRLLSHQRRVSAMSVLTAHVRASGSSRLRVGVSGLVRFVQLCKDRLWREQARRDKGQGDANVASLVRSEDQQKSLLKAAHSRVILSQGEAEMVSRASLLRTVALQLKSCTTALVAAALRQWCLFRAAAVAREQRLRQSTQSLLDSASVEASSEYFKSEVGRLQGEVEEQKAQLDDSQAARVRAERELASLKAARARLAARSAGEKLFYGKSTSQSLSSAKRSGFCALQAFFRHGRQCARALVGGAVLGCASLRRRALAQWCQATLVSASDDRQLFLRRRYDEREDSMLVMESEMDLALAKVDALMRDLNASKRETDGVRRRRRDSALFLLLGSVDHSFTLLVCSAFTRLRSVGFTRSRELMAAQSARLESQLASTRSGFEVEADKTAYWVQRHRRSNGASTASRLVHGCAVRWSATALRAWSLFAALFAAREAEQGAAALAEDHARRGERLHSKHEGAVRELEAELASFRSAAAERTSFASDAREALGDRHAAELRRGADALAAARKDAGEVGARLSGCRGELKDIIQREAEAALCMDDLRADLRRSLAEASAASLRMRADARRRVAWATLLGSSGSGSVLSRLRQNGLRCGLTALTAFRLTHMLPIPRSYFMRSWVNVELSADGTQILTPAPHAAAGGELGGVDDDGDVKPLLHDPPPPPLLPDGTPVHSPPTKVRPRASRETRTSLLRRESSSDGGGGQLSGSSSCVAAGQAGKDDTVFMKLEREYMQRSNTYKAMLKKAKLEHLHELAAVKAEQVGRTDSLISENTSLRLKNETIEAQLRGSLASATPRRAAAKWLREVLLKARARALAKGLRHLALMVHGPASSLSVDCLITKSVNNVPPSSSALSLSSSSIHIAGGGISSSSANKPASSASQRRRQQQPIAREAFSRGSGSMAPAARTPSSVSHTNSVATAPKPSASTSSGSRLRSTGMGGVTPRSTSVSGPSTRRALQGDGLQKKKALAPAALATTTTSSASTPRRSYASVNVPGKAVAGQARKADPAGTVGRSLLSSHTHSQSHRALPAAAASVERVKTTRVYASIVPAASNVR